MQPYLCACRNASANAVRSAFVQWVPQNLPAAETPRGSYPRRSADVMAQEEVAQHGSGRGSSKQASAEKSVEKFRKVSRKDGVKRVYTKRPRTVIHLPSNLNPPCRGALFAQVAKTYTVKQFCCKKRSDAI